MTKRKPNPFTKMGHTFEHLGHDINRTLIKPIERNIVKPLERNVVQPFVNKTLPAVGKAVENQLTQTIRMPQEVFHTGAHLVEHTEDSVAKIFSSPSTLIIAGVALLVLLKH